jgi:hypothetical protein
MASLTELPAVAQRILDLFSAQLSEQGVVIPARCYVAAGSMIVWDGEQMTVALMGITQGQPGVGYAQTYVPEALNLYASFSVALVRSVATISTEGFAGVEVPTAAQQDTDGQATIADAQALVTAASAIHVGHLLTGPGEGFVIDGLQPLGPEGGLAASRLLISLSLS